MEVRTSKQLPDGTWTKQTFKVVDHAKTMAGDRRVYLSKNARETIQCIIEANRAHGYSDNGYLFFNENGERAHGKNIDYRVRKLCNHANIPEKSMYKIRKTCISTLIDNNININEIRKQVGYEDERTTYGNYCFNRMTDTQTENLIELALSGN